jgi:hypothetical protein
LPVLGIDADNFRIDFFANGEAVGALFGTFTRQVGTFNRSL